MLCSRSAMNADRTVERGYHSSFASFTGVIGYMLLVVFAYKASGIAGLYVATIFATVGSFAQVPPRAACSTCNIAGHSKRAVGVHSYGFIPRSYLRRIIWPSVYQ
ncbi:hypothetical protein BDB00DRAFT_72140 [Zychaea mexicana]|uniref:uncharacterized protein n=1 Tax=Zychaea mexicana TaxID=64656 RepID=UPI0022FEB850|nr:uncharacterized protein BDB00DRAFT_72140 [Zychaea mexicana]KAI9496762.1 hypothetical protein BDB00DRAFT_72140 [Zychaea mexicana]